MKGLLKVLVYTITIIIITYITITLSIRVVVWRYSSESPDEKFERLIGELKEGNEVDRANAAGSLGMTLDPRACPYLVEALDDESSWVREEAESGLYAARNVQYLIKVLKDDTHKGKRHLFARLLGWIRQKGWSGMQKRWRRRRG